MCSPSDLPHTAKWNKIPRKIFCNYKLVWFATDASFSDEWFCHHSSAKLEVFRLSKNWYFAIASDLLSPRHVQTHAILSKCQWVASKALWCDQPTHDRSNTLTPCNDAVTIQNYRFDALITIRQRHLISVCFAPFVVRQACARAIPRPQPQSINWKSFSPSLTHPLYSSSFRNWMVMPFLGHVHDDDDSDGNVY